MGKKTNDVEELGNIRVADSIADQENSQESSSLGPWRVITTFTTAAIIVKRVRQKAAEISSLARRLMRAVQSRVTGIMTTVQPETHMTMGTYIALTESI
jgi:hypothetical protein